MAGQRRTSHGQPMGRYEVHALIGEGSVAQVLLALQGDGTPVAVKRMRSKPAQDRPTRTDFLATARALAEFHHPHLIPILEIGEEQKVPYFVMELARKGTLAEYIERHGPLGPEHALQILRPMVAVLAMLHARHLVHLDFKPQNILIVEPGVYKLGDAGLSVAPDKLATLPAASKVNICYAAPEHLLKPGFSDARADIFGFGATLWTALTGQIARQPLGFRSEPPPLDRVPEPLQVIVARACHPDPERRYASAADLERALREADRRLWATSSVEHRRVGIDPARLAEPAASKPARRPKPEPENRAYVHHPDSETTEVNELDMEEVAAEGDGQFLVIDPATRTLSPQGSVEPSIYDSPSAAGTLAPATRRDDRVPSPSTAPGTFARSGHRYPQDSLDFPEVPQSSFPADESDGGIVGWLESMLDRLLNPR